MGINHYVNRAMLKSALTIPSSTTGQHALLDDAAHTISRLFDEYVGYHFYPSSGTRYYTPNGSQHLDLGYPLLGLDSLQTSSDGGSTYGSTIDAGDVYLNPANATEEDPKRPFWEIEIKPNVTSSAIFPSGTRRGVKVTGTWGYFNQLKDSTATVATGLNSTTKTIKLNGSSAIHAGMTLNIGGERMHVVQSPASSTGTVTSAITVQRGVNGTSGVTHSCATAIQIYEYPIIERAALYQAEQDHRVKDAPFGYAGNDGVTQRPTMSGGLHPFVRNMLAGFRTPTVG